MQYPNETTFCVYETKETENVGTAFLPSKLFYASFITLRDFLEHRMR